MFVFRLGLLTQDSLHRVPWAHHGAAARWRWKPGNPACKHCGRYFFPGRSLRSSGAQFSYGSDLPTRHTLWLCIHGRLLDGPVPSRFAIAAESAARALKEGQARRLPPPLVALPPPVALPPGPSCRAAFFWATAPASCHGWLASRRCGACWSQARPGGRASSGRCCASGSGLCTTLGELWGRAPPPAGAVCWGQRARHSAWA